MQVEGSFQKIK